MGINVKKCSNLNSGSLVVPATTSLNLYTGLSGQKSVTLWSATAFHIHSSTPSTANFQVPANTLLTLENYVGDLYVYNPSAGSITVYFIREYD